MIELSIKTANTVDSPWLDVKRVVLGQLSQTLNMPEFYVLIEKSGAPYLRADVYPDIEQLNCFREEIIWESWAVIAYGNCVYFISLTDFTIRKLELNDYFGHLYPDDDFLLAASGSDLVKIGADAKIIWKSEPLAVDGVIVHDISGDVILGQGEWDPPGGWLPFKLSLATGKIVE